MLFWLAALFETWSEKCYAWAWRRRWERQQVELSPVQKELIATLYRVYAPALTANVTRSNALLKKLKENRQ